jgi:Lar family restriction alleviation protein
VVAVTTTTIVAGVELKPCPFCGSDDVDVTFTGETATETEAAGYCENCLAQGPLATIGCRDDEEYEIDIELEAAELWNQRAT